MTDSPVHHQPLTVRELYEKHRETWELELIAGAEGLDAEITTSELNRPALALAGWYGMFSADRIQLIGLTECAYLRELTAEQRLNAIEHTVHFSIPLIVVTSNEDICPELRAACEGKRIALMRSTQLTSALQTALHRFLERRLAPTWTVHGVMMDIFGMGVLIQGKSGVGKSEVGLELIERGHRLIADDVVRIRRVSRNVLLAETPHNIGYHMELRGIGIIDIELLFGVRAVRDVSKVSLRVIMEKWDAAKDYERLGIDSHLTDFHGCEIPEYVLPVEPGRNIAKLVEVAALMQRLEEQGINVALEFDKRIIAAMSGDTPARAYTAIDRLYQAKQK